MIQHGVSGNSFVFGIRPLSSASPAPDLPRRQVEVERIHRPRKLAELLGGSTGELQSEC
jgi:hypothetical protein